MLKLATSKNEDIMARTCEIPEDQGGIVAKVLREALQVPHQHAEVYHIPHFEESGGFGRS